MQCTASDARFQEFSGDFQRKNVQRADHGCKTIAHDKRRLARARMAAYRLRAIAAS
jgi:hypothetical protein